MGQQHVSKYSISHEYVHIPDDIIYHILTFVPSQYIFTNQIMSVSRQWKRVCFRLNISVDLKLKPANHAKFKLMAKCRYLNNLTDLNLRSTDLHHFGLSILLNSNRVKNLKILNLAGNYNLGHEGIQLLCECPNIGNLSSLSLEGCYLEPKSLKLLSSSLMLPYLCELNLSGNLISLESAKILFNSPYLSKQLKRWILKSCTFSDEHFEVFLSSNVLKNYNNLTLLDFSINYLTDNTASNLLKESNKFWNLQEFNLARNMFTSVGENLIRNCETLNKVVVLKEKQSNNYSKLRSFFIDQ
ncbi:hypothetical protein C9374_014588 [Naegleria lovaniensis]|uniref:F-box domain-containing protein n=1 Tax=Naegleria lovaniensis TaxID=51637 RepID=A0AA88H181_NAELO|nr:uncharacterized protein C9374_014588 [Naegleria lovaniensis]KAG2389188.1 hypothetical protein C9374_014588 [Naegleria lovaniensis]